MADSFELRAFYQGFAGFATCSPSPRVQGEVKGAKQGAK
jgi:hypothetical protein